jgi:TolB-like protein
MKRKILLVVCLALCAVFGFSQTIVTLDDALADITKYFTGRLPAKSKVVVLNISADSERMAEYIIEEFTANLVNSGKVTVVDRQNLESIRKELMFQVSGEVDDDTAQSIGRLLGAQTIFSGSISLLGDFYRLRLRAIAVQTAEIQGMQSANVGQDRILASLGGKVSAAPPPAPVSPPPGRRRPRPPVAPPRRPPGGNRRKKHPRCPGILRSFRAQIFAFLSI